MFSAGLREEHTNEVTNMKHSKQSQTTPAHILQGLLALTIEPGTPPDDRAAALELDMVLQLDPTAVRDLMRALFGEERINAGTQAGSQRVLDVLKSFGAFEQDVRAEAPEKLFLKFHARPLSELLKRMPHREPGMGLSINLIANY